MPVLSSTLDPLEQPYPLHDNRDGLKGSASAFLERGTSY